MNDLQKKLKAADEATADLQAKRKSLREGLIGDYSIIDLTTKNWRWLHFIQCVFRTIIFIKKCLGLNEYVLDDVCLWTSA